MMWRNYHSVVSVGEALKILAGEENRVRIIAGATDLLLEMERGVRKDIDTLIDITRIQHLDHIRMDEKCLIHLGPLVTHADCAASKLIIEQGFPLARACWEVGAPQIRNRGTVAGNLITASPANDTIPPLVALGATVGLQSIHGTREVPLKDFYTGVRKTVMLPDEMLVDIYFPALTKNQRGTFTKLGLRKAQAISLVNCAAILTLQGEEVQDAAITLGSIAPVIVHASIAEDYLRGKTFNPENFSKAAELAGESARPIDDIRSSKEYRAHMVNVVVKRCLEALFHRQERSGYPIHPVLLRENMHATAVKGTPEGRLTTSVHHQAGQPNSNIETTINGKPYVFSSGFHKTLLRLLREDAGLTGTKEGCDEGECGACTVFLDGMAVMSCMVPAVRAHHAEIVTIEGISEHGSLHPLQQAFIDAGAVQCGYCTPGFIMASAMLLKEIEHPTREQIKEGISGNLCRCTGYYSIIDAVERAAQTN